MFKEILMYFDVASVGFVGGYFTRYFIDRSRGKGLDGNGGLCRIIGEDITSSTETVGTVSEGLGDSISQISDLTKKSESASEVVRKYGTKSKQAGK